MVHIYFHVCNLLSLLLLIKYKTLVETPCPVAVHCPAPLLPPWIAPTVFRLCCLLLFFCLFIYSFICLLWGGGARFGTHAVHGGGRLAGVCLSFHHRSPEIGPQAPSPPAPSWLVRFCNFSFLSFFFLYWVQTQSLVQVSWTSVGGFICEFFVL